MIRRLSLDLIGLPPSPEEVDEFVSDQSPDAYERVVDRLLASPHFGERWARPWLDQARYADSNGYNIDAPRSIWKYRDWVIAAFNADMPFDQFAIDQIAGDLLARRRPLAQRIATGFHRNTQINQEGGIDLEQFRIESIVDRVNTTGSVFLGLTIGCAQCHDHKYDPIRQREYYELFAFFNNVDEPELEIATPSELARRRRSRRDRAIHRDLAARYPDLEQRERRWEGTLDARIHSGAGLPMSGWSSTRRGRNGRRPSGAALVELMLAREPALRGRIRRLTKLRGGGTEVRHHDGRVRAFEPAASVIRAPGRRLHPEGRTRRSGRPRRLASA